jgi:hypothetical protein
VVLLRKSVPQNHNLKTAAELGVTCVRILRFRVLKVRKKQKHSPLQAIRIGKLFGA